MSYSELLILLLGVSVSLHAATASALFSLRAGRGHAESILSAGFAAATTLSLWLTVISFYR